LKAAFAYKMVSTLIMTNILAVLHLPSIYAKVLLNDFLPIVHTGVIYKLCTYADVFQH